MKRLLVCLLLVGVVGCETSPTSEPPLAQDDRPAPPPVQNESPEPPLVETDADKAISEYNKGIDFADREDWATAIAHFTEAIRLDPDYAKAYAGRSLAYRKLGQDEKADAAKAKACSLDSQHC